MADKEGCATHQVKSLIGQQELNMKTITYSTVLGRGSFAAVFKAKCDELPCAAKILHTIFHDDPAIESFKERFYQECEHLKNIKHPNIVQYLGLCQEPAANQPVLLMELMDQSLTQFLERSTALLSRDVQLRLCHDIALALAHLHSLGIVHRDLSSNNILLIGPGSRAKVSDFGMSKVLDQSKSKYTTPLTMVPGTVAYMPQEALGLGEDILYTEKLDCFSFGVLAIQIMTRLFPNPSSRTKKVESDLSPIGISVPVAETECRKEHIDMIDKTNPLLDVAIQCISLKMEDRPPASELCLRVENLRDALPSIHNTNSENMLDSEPKLITADSECKFPECQAIKRKFENEIASLLEQLEDAKSENSAAKDDLGTRALQSTPSVIPSRGLSIATWKTGSPSPDVVARSSTTVVNNNMCCCLQNIVYEYDVKSNKWRELPRLSAADYIGVLIVYHKEMRKLIAVKNTTLYIVHNGEWVAQGNLEFIPWGIIYYENYVTFFDSSGKALLVQFSSDSVHVRSSFRIFPIIAYASIAICNGAIYIVGINQKQIWSNQVYRLPLHELFPSSTMPKFSLLDWSFFKKGKRLWQELNPLPLSYSTSVTFNNNLLAVGGFSNNQASGDIFLYDEEQDRWEMIGRIPTPRYNCLAEVVGDQLVVVGGWLNPMVKCNIVEIAVLVY